MALALVIAGLAVLSFVGGDGGDGNGGGDSNGGAPGTAAPATTAAPTTTARGFPPAPADSACRLLSRAEAEVLVGYELEHDVIEPIPAQCAWPRDTGNPNNAVLFFIVKEPADADLRTVLEATWDQDDFSLEPVPDLGDQAFFVVRQADPELEIPEFVEGLDVYASGFHLVLGNGGVAPIWEGTGEDIRTRLRDTMTALVARVAAELGEGPGPPT